MKHTIFSKIFFSYLLLIIILSLLISIFSFRIIREYYIQSLAEDLEKSAVELRTMARAHIRKNNFRELDRMLKTAGRIASTRITLIDHNGKVFSDSLESPERMENHANRPEIQAALHGTVGQSIRHSRTMGEEMLYVAIPFTCGNSTWILRTSLFVKDIQKLLNKLNDNIINITAAIILFGMLGAFLISRNLSQPIRKVAHASRLIAGGNFDIKVTSQTNDELKELADRFNEMTEHIKRLFSRISLQKDELNSIISSLNEGFLVINREGRITLSNRSLTKITTLQEDSKDMYYWEVIREPEFLDFTARAEKSSESLTEEIKINNRIFLCSITALESQKGFVIIFHDITEMKQLQKIKKDFVTNVSHELRTPLTSMKGFIETLKEAPTDDSFPRYVHIIEKNTDRLINIVNDLLSLSELEEQKITLERENVELNSLIQNGMGIFESRITARDLSFRFHAEKKVYIFADAFRIEQMFINLIDNAIKYTEKGSIEISLTSEEDNTARISIKDTGIGIPQEHQPRIFERFYVTNKARSRKMGGTGLGLSIVKHIVIQHGGKINVKSKPGTGTEFIVSLPCLPETSENNAS